MTTCNGPHAVDERPSIDLPPEVHDQLAALAEVERSTLPELIREAVASHKIRSEHRIVPEDADLIPDHWRCRLRRHRELRWTEETERSDRTGTRTRVVFAECTDCGRHQTRVRVEYRPSHTFNVTPAVSEPERADTGDASEDGS